MSLTTLLLIVVAILTLLSGIAVISGAHRGDRLQASLFLFTTIMAFGWAVGIGVFLSLPPDTMDSVTWKIIDMIYVSATIMSWGLMAYTCNKYKLGRIGIFVQGVVCLFFVGVIIACPHCIFDGFELNEITGNIVYVKQGVFYTLFGAYHFLSVAFYMYGLWYAARNAKTPGVKRANMMVLIGFTITGALSLIFNFILPYFRHYDTVWVGIFAMSIAWIFHYYAILRYRLLDLSSPWLRGFSHVIVMSLAAVAYLIIFFIIFGALFKVPEPSVQVIILNILMIVAVLLLFPALNELSTFISSLSSSEEVDVSYIVKKLTALSGCDINLTELAGFLRDHLHFQYFGFVLDGELYGSQKIKLSQETITKVSQLKKSVGNIWLEPDEELAKALRKEDIAAVIELRNSKGKIIGQVLLGKPTGKISFENRDQVPIEIVMQVVPVVTHPSNHCIKKHLI